jgi:hypothetical protein
LLDNLVGAPVALGNVRVGLSPYEPLAVGSAVPAGSAGPVVAAADALGAAGEVAGAAPDVGAAPVATALVVVGVAEAPWEDVLPLAQAERPRVNATEQASTSGERRTRRPQAFKKGKCD